MWNARACSVIYDKNIFRLIDIVRDSCYCNLNEDAPKSKTMSSEQYQHRRRRRQQTYTTTGITICENDARKIFSRHF